MEGEFGVFEVLGIVREMGGDELEVLRLELGGEGRDLEFVKFIWEWFEVNGEGDGEDGDGGALPQVCSDS